MGDVVHCERDLGVAWPMSFLCLTLIRGEGDRLTLVDLVC
jgi:hypothetical protein